MNQPKLNHLMEITARPENVFVRGEGSWLWDESGNRYLDFIQGWAVNCLGHCPAEVQGALAQQAGQLISPSPALHNQPQLTLAERLVALSGMKEVHFTNSGAEANEAAIKLARKWGRLNRGGAYRIISAQNAFHGRTLATMAASGKPGWDQLFPPYPDGFRQVPFGDAEAVARVIDAETVAILVEPVQGEAGVVVPPPDYLADLRRLADAHDLLLILDEIQTGMGRTGTLFAFQAAGVRPDILTLGKGLGGGVPLAAVLADERAACFEAGDQGGTYNGNALMTAVGLAVTDTVSDPGFLAHVRCVGAQLQEGLASFVCEGRAAVVRGKGLLQALRLNGDHAERLRDEVFAAGLIVNAARPDTLRFMPSLRVSAAEVDQCLEILAEAL